MWFGGGVSKAGGNFGCTMRKGKLQLVKVHIEGWYPLIAHVIFFVLVRILDACPSNDIGSAEYILTY